MKTKKTALFWFMVLATSMTKTTTRSIFILSGQSNMVGEGGVVHLSNGSYTYKWDGYIPPECQANLQILRLKSDLSWEEAREPLHQDIPDGTCGIGPGIPFANSVLKGDPSIGVIGLVPCAVGATKISQWLHGTTHYNIMLIRARAAVSNGGGVIRALLWYQGEADTGEKPDAELDKSRLVEFITDLRNDLQSPSLPVFQVALTSGVNASLMEIVRKAQLETGLRNVTCVDAKDLALEPGNLHLTTPSQVRLGTMLANAFHQTQMV